MESNYEQEPFVELNVFLDEISKECGFEEGKIYVCRDWTERGGEALEDGGGRGDLNRVVLVVHVSAHNPHQWLELELKDADDKKSVLYVR